MFRAIIYEKYYWCKHCCAFGIKFMSLSEFRGVNGCSLWYVIKKLIDLYFILFREIIRRHRCWIVFCALGDEYFYDNYVSFALDGIEVARWNKSFNYGDMHMYAGTFYTHWLTGELSTVPLEMNIEWMRRGYFQDWTINLTTNKDHEL